MSRSGLQPRSGLITLPCSDDPCVALGDVPGIVVSLCSMYRDPCAAVVDVPGIAGCVVSLCREK